MSIQILNDTDNPNEGRGKINSNFEELYSATTSSYLVYTALLNQSGTTAPTVVTVGQNTLGITPVYAYSDVGAYTITSTGSFPEGKTRVFGSTKVVTFIGGIGVNTNKGINYGQSDENELYINTYNANGAGGAVENGVLNGWDTWIEIRVYS